MTIFISHAGADKPHVEPLVRALMKTGRAVFIDRPEDPKWAFQPEEVKIFKDELRLFHIQNSEAWDEEIRKALRECSVVLGCLSKNVAQDRRIWSTELNYAHVERKLVTCRLTGTEYSDLPAELELFRPKPAQNQPINGAIVFDAVSKEERGEALSEQEDHELRLFRFLLNAIDDVLTGDPPPLVDPTGREAEIDTLTFRAGRRAQRDDIDRAFKIVEDGGVRALAIGGPRNEKVDDFAEAIVKCRLARGIVEAPRVIVASLPSPDRFRTWRDFKTEYGVKVAEELQMPRNADATPTGIASFIANQKQAVLCLNQPLNWKHLPKRRTQVDHWLKFWREVSESPASPSVVTVFRASLAEAAPGWQPDPPEDPPDIQGMRARDFVAWMERLAKPSRAGLRFFGSSSSLLDQLDLINPIELEDAREWVGLVCLELQKLNKETSTAERMFQSKAERDCGLAMRDFERVAAKAVCDELSAQKVGAQG